MYNKYIFSIDKNYFIFNFQKLIIQNVFLSKSYEKVFPIGLLDK